MRFIAVVFVTFLAPAALAQDLPPRSSAGDYIDPQAELESLGTMDGVWIGTFRPVYDPVGANREWPDGFPLRIEIRGENVGLWLIEEGDVLDPFPGEAALMFNVDGTALIDYVAGNEAFNEIWSISLNHVSPNQLKGFISRTVHNFAYRRDSPWRVFPVYSVVDFERER